MIEEVSGCIDYDECGAGPAIVLVPGSCSTGAAWRPIIADLSSRFRCVTTSLLGYGGTVEGRTGSDPSISHEAEALESVVEKPVARSISSAILSAAWWRWSWRSAIKSRYRAL
jgi:pimeloyl-ACP methyl ester carboxylesterase